MYRIVDGADADWASWYADWLVSLDKQYTVGDPWERFYAQRLAEHFRARLV